MESRILNDEELEFALEDCFDYFEKFNSQEQQFLESVDYLANQGRRLTDKQRFRLTELWDKV